MQRLPCLVSFGLVGSLAMDPVKCLQSKFISTALCLSVLVLSNAMGCDAYWTVLEQDQGGHKLIVDPDFGLRGQSTSPVKFSFEGIEPLEYGTCYITRLEFVPKDVWADNISKFDDCTGFVARVTVAEDAGPDGPRKVVLTFVRRGSVFEELEGRALFYVVGGRSNLGGSDRGDL